MRIDSHQHFWVYDPGDYPWIPQVQNVESLSQVESLVEPDRWEPDRWAPDRRELGGQRKLDRDFFPSDLQPLLKAAGIDGRIAVQARQSLPENKFLLDLADQNEFILGVVGWIDLRSDNAREQAKQFASHPKSVGVRHVVQDEPQQMFMAGEAFRRGIDCLSEFDLIYDILIYEHQLADAFALVEAFPERQFVIDHIAKPKIKSGQLEPWRTHLRKLAERNNVVVKVSGMVTEADHWSWTAEQLEPYWQEVLEAFTPSRILFGSGWPVLCLASSCLDWVTTVDRWLAPLSDSERMAIWGYNALRIYLNN